MKKMVIPIVVVVIVVAAIAVYYAQMKKSNAPAPTGQEQTNKDNFDPKNPNFVLGTVTKAQAGQIQFKSGLDDSTANISSSTKLVKQEKVGADVKVLDATLADFKVGKTIVVYFSTPGQNHVYTADKVQIIQ